MGAGEGDGGGGELVPTPVASSFFSCMPKIGGGGLMAEVTAMVQAWEAVSVPGSFLISTEGGVGTGAGRGGLGEGFLDPTGGDMDATPFSVPPADTSVNGFSLSISCSLEPDTGRFLFFSSAFSLATLRSSSLSVILGMVSAARDTGLALVPWLGIGRFVVDVTTAGG